MEFIGLEDDLWIKYYLIWPVRRQLRDGERIADGVSGWYWYLFNVIYEQEAI